MVETLVQPKSSIVNAEPKQNYFVASSSIIPLKPLTPINTLIPENIKNYEVLPESKLNKKTKTSSSNYIKRFFSRLFKYVSNLENFLSQISKLTLKKIEQDKIILISEKTEQQQRNYKATKLVKQINEEEKEQENQNVNLQDNPGLALALAGALGLGVATAVSQTQQEIPTVDYQPIDGQLVPKGTSGVSGYPISSYFGNRRHPITGEWRLHGGVDVGVPEGTMFAVKAKSQVVFAGWQVPGNPKGGYGLLVDVWVPSINQMLRFAHLSSVSVKVGQQIDAGKVLGRAGSTGLSTGPHFHIEAHSTVTSNYGGKDPTPYLGYVILGDQIKSSSTRVGDFDGRVRNNESEGGINFGRKILVGEAGTELLIRMSQMPLFVDAMMQEKIKCLNPFYQVSEGFETNMPVSSGSAKTTFASGGITGGSPEFWQMVAISATEDVLHPQGQADVAQSIYNRIAVGSYPGGTNITKIIVADGQYQPTFKNPGDWSKIKDRKSAIHAAKILPYVGKKAPTLIDSAARAITNPALQKAAAAFVGGRTDFMGESQKPYMKPGDITRGKNHNFFGWFYDARLPKAAPIHPSVKSMTKAANAPSQPKSKDKNIFEKFMLWINPPKSERASLNQIDSSTQMNISKTYSNVFDFENISNEVVAFYQPTIYYSV